MFNSYCLADWPPSQPWSPVSLQYRYRRKDDELRDLADRRKQLLRRMTTEEDVWGDGGKDKKSLPMSHKDRLLSRLSREGRGSTPERVEFEASVDLQSESEEGPSIMGK